MNNNDIPKAGKLKEDYEAFTNACRELKKQYNNLLSQYDAFAQQALNTNSPIDDYGILRRHASLKKTKIELSKCFC